MAPVEEITTTKATGSKKNIATSLNVLTSHADLKVDGVCHDVCRIMAKFLNGKPPPSPESGQEAPAAPVAGHLLLPDVFQQEPPGPPPS